MTENATNITLTFFSQTLLTWRSCSPLMVVHKAQAFLLGSLPFDLLFYPFALLKNFLQILWTWYPAKIQVATSLPSENLSLKLLWKGSDWVFSVSSVSLIDWNIPCSGTVSGALLMKHSKNSVLNFE